MSDQALGATEIAVVVDVKQRLPACVIIQAMNGCAEGRRIVSELFPPETWLLAPNSDMHTVRGTREEWESFATEMAEAKRQAPR